MPTITAQLDAAFRAAITAAFGFDADPAIAATTTDKFGDYQANAAMGLAKELTTRTGQKTNPRQVAEQIKGNLQLGEMASEISIAGPGFINVRLAPAWLAGQLRSAATSANLGIDPAATPQTVVVDYSGPNIAKQMHVGHLRSTIIGDALARTLQLRGENVIRQNHLGDWGTQFGRVVLAMWYEAVFTHTGNAGTLASLIQRQQDAGRALAEQKESNEAAAKTAYAAAIGAIVGDLLPFHQKFINDDPHGTAYFDDYLRNGKLNLDELERAYVFVSAITDNPEAERAPVVHPVHGERTLADLPRLITTFIQNPGHERNKQEELAWRKAREITIVACYEIYRRLRVQLADPGVQAEPLERGESFYNPYLPAVVADLRTAGIAVESEGAIVVVVEGYENPLIIEKRPTITAAGESIPGGFLYGTTDLAAIRYRVGTLGAGRVLYFTDARQSQHFAQVFTVAKRAGWTGSSSLEHAPFGTMLGEDGKPFKTRSGDVVRLSALLDEAEERALAVINEKNPELSEAQRKDIARAVGIGAVKYSDLSKDRTSDYIFSWEKMLSFDGNTAPYLQNAYVRIKSIFRKAGVAPSASADFTLVEPSELALAKQILRFPETIESVSRELKPHLLCTYLYDLATRFHSFYEHCPVLKSEEPTRSSRLALSDLTARTLAQGLGLLGIEHPEQM